MRDNLVPQKTVSQIAQFGDGFVMDTALPGDINHSHGADVAKVFESLARGAFAELKPLNQIVHRERARGNEEQTVDFRQGPRLPEQPRQLDEEVDLRLFSGLSSAAA